MFEQNNVGIRLTNPLTKTYMGLLAKGTSSDQDISKFYETAMAVIDNISDNCDDNCDDNCSDSNDEDDDEEDDGNNEDDDSGHDAQGDSSKLTIDSEVEKLESLINDSGGADNIFPPLDGAAFYANICKINHSCSPNVIVRYTMLPCEEVDHKVTSNIDTVLGSNANTNVKAAYNKRGLIAEVTVLRSIKEGEELLQSYIDETLDNTDRNKALLDYGFTCKCLKCLGNKNY